jgi:hypothetical protein
MGRRLRRPNAAILTVGRDPLFHLWRAKAGLLTEERMPLPAATLHGAASIAVPTLVSTLAISCVFVSVVFLHGPAKYLFTPLGPSISSRR